MRRGGRTGACDGTLPGSFRAIRRSVKAGKTAVCPWLRGRGRATIPCCIFQGGSESKVSLDTPREDLTVRHERAVLVSVALPDRPWLGTDPLEELRGLATTARATVVGGLTQKRESIHPGTYIGKGKLQE